MDPHWTRSDLSNSARIGSMECSLQVRQPKGRMLVSWRYAETHCGRHRRGYSCLANDPGIGKGVSCYLSGETFPKPTSRTNQSLPRSPFPDRESLWGTLGHEIGPSQRRQAFIGFLRRSFACSTKKGDLRSGYRTEVPDGRLVRVNGTDASQRYRGHAIDLRGQDPRPSDVRISATAAIACSTSARRYCFPGLRPKTLGRRGMITSSAPRPAM
jgi:hypothetical protein